ncbi:MAG: flippase-like domain-containing protein [Proteobacteria bacterium]|nr:flippase-like domain-containing protein [Pseudomonadota bacterium]
MKRVLFVLVQVGIISACVFYALKYLDVPRVLAALAQVPVWKVFCVFLFQASLAWVATPLRIYFLCRFEPPLATVVQALGLGQFLNLILPAKLGEAAKLALLRRVLPDGLAGATEIVFWERFFDLNALLTLALISGALMGSTTFSAPLGLLVLGIWGAVFALEYWWPLVERLMGRLPWPRLTAYFSGIATALQHRLSLRFALSMGGLTLILWGGEVLMQGIMLSVAFGFDLTPAQILVTAVVGMAGLSAPATPGSIGVYEAAMVASLTAFGQPKEESLAAALLMHAIMILPVLLIGLWAMLSVGFRAALRLSETAPDK